MRRRVCVWICALGCSLGPIRGGALGLVLFGERAKKKGEMETDAQVGVVYDVLRAVGGRILKGK